MVLKMINKNSVYIAGPMTGKPDLNFPAFRKAAKELRSQGYLAVNPAELEPNQSATWQDCMRKDIAELVKCEFIYLLPGWQESRGATTEMFIAQRLGIKWLNPESAELAA